MKLKNAHHRYLTDAIIQVLMQSVIKSPAHVDAWKGLDGILIMGLSEKKKVVLIAVRVIQVQL